MFFFTIFFFFFYPGLTHFLYYSSSGIFRLNIIYHKSLPRKVKCKTLCWVYIFQNKRGVMLISASHLTFFFFVGHISKHAGVFAQE